MEGFLFCDHDYGQVGPSGYLDHRQNWCVDYLGKKIHIKTHLTGERGRSSSQGGPTRTIAIEFCDGSCKKPSEIPGNIWNKAKPQIIEAVEIDNAGLSLNITKEQLNFAFSAGIYQGA
jgi:hypothetical protein